MVVTRAINVMQDKSDTQDSTGKPTRNWSDKDGEAEN